MFKLQFTLDNDAFTGDRRIQEIARVLQHEVIRLLKTDPECADHGPVPIRDHNGNTIGKWELSY